MSAPAYPQYSRSLKQGATEAARRIIVGQATDMLLPLAYRRLVMDTLPGAGETFTVIVVGGITQAYTFVAVWAAPGDVAIGASIAATMANLATEITAVQGAQVDVTYTAGNDNLLVQVDPVVLPNAIINVLDGTTGKIRWVNLTDIGVSCKGCERVNVMYEERGAGTANLSIYGFHELTGVWYPISIGNAIAANATGLLSNAVYGPDLVYVRIYGVAAPVIDVWAEGYPAF